MKLKALDGRVLVDEILRGAREFGESKIVLLDDNGKGDGIRPRWCRVYSVGSDIDRIKPGDWILVKHGNWTRGMNLFDDDGNKMTVWEINWPDGALLVSDEPYGETFAGDQTITGHDVAKLER